MIGKSCIFGLFAASVRLSLLLALLANALPLKPLAAAEAIPNFRPGTDLRKPLDSLVGMQWKQVPLRAGLSSLCQDQPFTIMLDRRIDPDLRVDFSAQQERLEVSLLRLSKQLNVGTTTVGTAIYIGPAATAERLATVAAMRRLEAAAAGGQIAQRMAAAQPTNWKELATPRELIVQVAQEAGLSVVNPEAIPHDLWAEGSWPPMPTADRLSLLLAGFDLTYRFTSQGLQVVSIPADLKSMTALHGLRGDAAKAIAEVQRLFPDAKVERQGQQLAVSAPFEVQEKVDRLLRGEQIRKVQVGTPTTRYTLNVDNQPAGAVVQTVAKQLNKQPKYSAEVRQKLTKLVSFQVKDVTLDELLAAALHSLELRYVLTDDALEIVDD